MSADPGRARGEALRVLRLRQYGLPQRISQTNHRPRPALHLQREHIDDADTSRSQCSKFSQCDPLML